MKKKKRIKRLEASLNGLRTDTNLIAALGLEERIAKLEAKLSETLESVGNQLSNHVAKLFNLEGQIESSGLSLSAQSEKLEQLRREITMLSKDHGERIARLNDKAGSKYCELQERVAKLEAFAAARQTTPEATQKEANNG